MSARRDLLASVNETVNRFEYKTDMDEWKRPEFWERISTAGVGDCEDFALEKRARLPLEDLRLAECLTETNEEHAILLCKDGENDWALDQRQPGLVTLEDLRQLGYHGDRLQVPGQRAWEDWIL
jgi:predicted transglutaminase-like cysteine proteinase